MTVSVILEKKHRSLRKNTEKRTKERGEGVSGLKGKKVKYYEECCGPNISCRGIRATLFINLFLVARLFFWCQLGFYNPVWLICSVKQKH